MECVYLLMIKGNRHKSAYFGILLQIFFWPTVRKNCSSDREKLLKFEGEGREFAKILRSLEQFVPTVQCTKGQNAFLTYSWRFFWSNKLSRTIQIQIGKDYWDLETCRKS